MSYETEQPAIAFPPNQPAILVFSRTTGVDSTLIRNLPRSWVHVDERYVFLSNPADRERHPVGPELIRKTARANLFQQKLVTT